MYVAPPRKISDQGKVLWILLAAAYSLLNSNENLHELSDSLLIYIGFTQMAVVPPLFFIKNGGVMIFILVKFVDDILITVSMAFFNRIIDSIDNHSKLVTVVYGPRNMPFLGLNIISIVTT